MVVKKDFMDMGQNRRIKKKRGRRWFGRKTGMDMGQNRRIEKQRESRGFGEEDRIGYGSK
jgi:hypothetical protein